VALGTAYDGLAAGWDTGAGHVYRPLARALVAASPVALGGRLVLDVGSGTGAVAEAAAASGARVVAADRTVSMVAYQGTERWPAVAADALRLPFVDGAFDATLAGFLLNHLAPAPALAELARVVRPGGAVLASTWAAERPDPVKTAIDAVITAWGWVAPAWYQAMKTEVEPTSGDPARLAAAAREAGVVEVSASARGEDLGVRDPSAVVAYRLTMPHIAPWVAALDAPTRAEVTRQALAAVAGQIERWRPAVILLAGRVAAHATRVAAHPSRRVADRSRTSL